MEVYLDNAATTKLSDSMKEYLCSILDVFGAILHNDFSL